MSALDRSREDAPEPIAPAGDDDLEDLREADTITLLRRKIEQYRAANLALRQSIRYRIGDAFYRVARNPLELLLLPFRLLLLVIEAIRRPERRHGVGEAEPRPHLDPAFPAPLPAGSLPLRPTALFFAINGVGLGHLARCLAVARHLKDLTPVFVTTCRRAHVLDQYGIRYHYVPSPGEVVEPGIVPDATSWNQLLSMVMSALYDAYRPAVLVTDGISAYAGLVQAWRQAPEVGRVGIRRAYRLDGRERAVLARDREYHMLLLPHHESEEEIPLPKGPASTWVGPLVLVGRDEGLTREEARAELGLRQDALAVLVQMGAGALGRGKELERRLIRHLAASEVQVVVTSYDPALADVGEGRVLVRHKFPMASAFRAFDLAIAAAGYNTFHELMHHGVPTVFVPNAETQSDDQIGRARRAAEAGAAFWVDEQDEGGLRAAVDLALDDPEARGSLVEGARALVPRNGAYDAAALITDFARRILERQASGR